MTSYQRHLEEEESLGLTFAAVRMRSICANKKGAFKLPVVNWSVKVVLNFGG